MASQYPPIVPALPASVSPSPFAPPPASAPIAGPVSQPLPLPSSSSSSQAKSPDVVRVHPDRPDQLAPANDLESDEHPAGSEYVTEHTSASTSHSDAGEATADHLDAFARDPPDQPQPRTSRQVCLSSRAVLLSACVYAYESCDRDQYLRLWIPPIAPLHHALPRGAHRRPLCSFLRHLNPLNSCPIPFLQKNPTHRSSYPSIRCCCRHRRRRHRRSVDEIDAVTHRSSPRPTNKDGN